MDVLTTILVVLVVVAILYEVAQRVGVPYPALIVLESLPVPARERCSGGEWTLGTR
jgi:hypothetical protein